MSQFSVNTKPIPSQNCTQSTRSFSEIRANLYSKSHSFLMVQTELVNAQKFSRERHLNRSLLLKEVEPYCNRCISSKSSIGSTLVHRSNSKPYIPNDRLSFYNSHQNSSKKPPIRISHIFNPPTNSFAQNYSNKRLQHINKVKLDLNLIRPSDHHHHSRSVRFSSHTKDRDRSGEKQHSVSLFSKSSRKEFGWPKRLSRLREDSQDRHLLSIKIKKNDLDEILSYIGLSYTYQMIEKSAACIDRTYSGSFLPTLWSQDQMYYVGGYGCIDGVTECANVNKAAEKFQFIAFNNDEAIEALGHMYGMNRLLDGVDPIRTLRRESKMMPIRFVPSSSDTEITESSITTMLW